MSRPTFAQIDLDAIRHNLAVLRRQVPGRSFMAVIKANAYGHGAIPVARALADCTEKFAVAIAEEALELRAVGSLPPIVILEGPMEPSDFLHAFEGLQIEWVIHSPAQWAWLLTLGRPSRVWIKINIGMNRLGFPPEALPELLNSLGAHPRIALQGIVTHFSNADEPASLSHHQQLQVLETLRRQHPHLVYSCANSAASLGAEPGIGDWLRPGIALYGASPFLDRSAVSLGLRAAMCLQSRLISCRPLQPGDTVGYGASWRATSSGRMGVIPMGYADGLPRALSSAGVVLVRGQRVGMIGRVSMDMIAIDLSSVPDAEVGDIVEIWGSQVAVDEQAARAGTLGYELLASMGERVPRGYA